MRCQDFFLQLVVLSGTRTTLSQLILYSGLVTVEGQHRTIQCTVCIEIEDVGFPNILVTLCGERGWLLFPSASSFPFGMKFCDTQSQECRTF